MTQVDVAVRERRIRKAVTERIKRIIIHIEIVAAEFLEPFAIFQWASGIFVRIIKRYLADILRESHGQFSTRIDVTEEGVTNGVSGFTTSEPYIQNGRHMLLFPIQRKRTSGE